MDGQRGFETAVGRLGGFGAEIDVEGDVLGRDQAVLGGVDRSAALRLAVGREVDDEHEGAIAAGQVGEDPALARRQRPA